MPIPSVSALPACLPAKAPKTPAAPSPCQAAAAKHGQDRPPHRERQRFPMTLLCGDQAHAHRQQLSQASRAVVLPLRRGFLVCPQLLTRQGLLSCSSATGSPRMRAGFAWRKTTKVALGSTRIRREHDCAVDKRSVTAEPSASAASRGGPPPSPPAAWVTRYLRPHAAPKSARHVHGQETNPSRRAARRRRGGRFGRSVRQRAIACARTEQGCE
jgi:hypothetical protein